MIAHSIFHNDSILGISFDRAMHFQGSSGFASHIDALMEIGEYFEEQVNSRPEFMLVSKRQYMNVCFWYIPRFLRGKPKISDHYTLLHKVCHMCNTTDNLSLFAAFLIYDQLFVITMTIKTRPTTD